MKAKNRKFIGNELKYVKEVLLSDMKSATGGSWNKKLEKAFCDKFGVKFAIAHNSGTSALHSCLSAIGVGPGDEVISPAITVMMNTLTILHHNAVPVYADVNPDTFNIDPADIERKITKRTKAIMAVSIYGLPPDLEPIMKIAKKHGIYVIEDNAECYLGYYKGRVAGSIGHMAIFSMENSKHISVGEGGMVVTNNEKLAERIRKCGGIGFKNLRAEEGRVRLNEDIFQDPAYKRHDYFGWNYRLPELNAAVGLAQMERLEEIVAKRQKIASFYDDAIGDCKWLKPQQVPKGYVSACWTYGVKYEGKKILGKDWYEFRKVFKSLGGDGFYAAWSVPYLEPVIQNGVFYGDKGCPVKCPLYKGKFEYKKGICLQAEALQPKIMQFKTNYRDIKLAKEQADIIKKTIKIMEKGN